MMQDIYLGNGMRFGVNLPTNDPFDLCLCGVLPATSPTEDKAIVERYRNAGVTWWIEFLYSGTGSLKQNLKRIRLGPPKG
jgi:hypothetical protein